MEKLRINIELRLNSKQGKKDGYIIMTIPDQQVLTELEKEYKIEFVKMRSVKISRLEQTTKNKER